MFWPLLPAASAESTRRDEPFFTENMKKVKKRVTAKETAAALRCTAEKTGKKMRIRIYLFVFLPEAVETDKGGSGSQNYL